MPVRGRTGHTNGGTKRSVDIEDLRKQQADLLLTPQTPERRVNLRRLRSRIRNATEFRSERNGA